MPNRNRLIAGAIGCAVALLGGVTVVVTSLTGAGFARDPHCTTSLTLRTPPASGPTCTISAGSISSSYVSTTHGSTNHQLSDDHVVVRLADGTTLDVVLANEGWSRMYDRAKPGLPAVVETVNGRPAFIATDAGTLSSEGDPHANALGAWLLTGAGILVAVLALRRAPAGSAFDAASGRAGGALGASLAVRRFFRRLGR